MSADASRTEALPPALAELASDPRLSLRGGRFHSVNVDQQRQTVTTVIDSGDLMVGYRRLTLTFHEASIDPPDLAILADAIGAEFRANHWHQRRAVTEIDRFEVDVLPDGRYVVRLRLRPFHAFAIEFATLSVVEAPMSGRGPSRAGRFTLDAGDGVSDG